MLDLVGILNCWFSHAKAEMYVVPVAKCRVRCQMLCALANVVCDAKILGCVAKCCVRYKMCALPNVVCVTKCCALPSLVSVAKLRTLCCFELLVPGY